MSTNTDNPQLCDTSNADTVASNVLPTDLDHSNMRNNHTVIVSRILRKHFKFFEDNVPAIEAHIQHVHSKEMSLKSTVVPLGVLAKNETRHEDMASIMAHLQQFVPVQSESFTIEDPVSEEEIPFFVDKFHYLLFGGDQLTVERAVGTQSTCVNEWRGLDRLEGLIPVVEDWHAKVCLLKAIWKILYRTSSGSNSGTLYHLRNLIQRRTVTVKIKADPTACEDFFLLVVEAHIICLAMKDFEIQSKDSVPSSPLFGKDNFLQLTPKERLKSFKEIITRLLEKYLYTTDLDRQNPTPTQTTKKGRKKNKKKKEDKEDRIMAYGREILTLGLLYMEYCDSIKEGDGLRILRCWRYMLLMFKMTNKRKYSIQASTFLLQHEFILTERLRNQLLWSRTINVHGKPGKNIPTDLHMEHLNRILKDSMRHLSSNTKEESIQRIGRCLGKLIEFQNNFDQCTGVLCDHGHHTKKSKSKDLQLVIDEINKTNVFKETEGRKHTQFPNFEGNILSQVNKTQLITWLHTQLVKLVK